MPRTENANQQIRNTQRARILEAAKEVFYRKGWNTTITDIASAAKVSQGLIYHYFANKETIFGEVMKQSVRPGPDIFQKIRQSDGTPSQRLEELISGLLKSRSDLIKRFAITSQMAREHSPSGNNLEIMHRMFHSLRSSAPDAKNLRELMMKRFDSLHEIVMKLIAEGQNTGEFAQDDPSKLSFMIIACIQSLTTLAINQPEEYKKHYPYTEIIMRMVRPGSEGPKPEEEKR